MARSSRWRLFSNTSVTKPSTGLHWLSMHMELQCKGDLALPPEHLSSSVGVVSHDHQSQLLQSMYCLPLPLVRHRRLLDHLEHAVLPEISGHLSKFRILFVGDL